MALVLIAGESSLGAGDGGSCDGAEKQSYDDFHDVRI